METSNFETMAITIMVKGSIPIGIVMCLMGVTIAAYRYFFRKRPLKEIGSYLGYTVGLGILVVLSGPLVSFIAGFDMDHIDFSSYKRIIPIAYIVALFWFLITKNLRKK